MQIKRFEAKNMSEALRLIKKELGPDAVLLSARSLKKQSGLLNSLRRTGVEVTAAIDTAQPAPIGSASKNVSGRRRLAPSDRPVDALQRRRAIRSYDNYRAGRTDTADNLIKRNGDHEHGSRGMDHDLYRQLIAQEMEDAIAAEIVSEIESRTGSETDQDPDALVTHIGKALKKSGIRTAPFQPLPANRTVICFTGLSGAGKTATVVKLASRLALSNSARVALISLDNQRIAGTEPLKVSSRILGVPFATAFNAKQFKDAMQQFDDVDLILVDTPALTLADPTQIQRLRKILSGCRNLQTCLICSATTRTRHHLKVLSHLKAISPERVVITKLDESDTFGCLFNLPARLRLPLAAVSQAPGGPENLSMASTTYLAGLVLNREAAPQSIVNRSQSEQSSTWGTASDRAEVPADSGTLAGGPEKSGAYFVANKNSDVFHVPDCRWTKMIKEDNVIVFASAAEAGRQHFKPCRSCCQDHLVLRRNSAGTVRRQQAAGTG